MPDPRPMISCPHCLAPVDLTGLPAGGMIVCDRCGGWLDSAGQPVTPTFSEDKAQPFMPKSARRGLDRKPLT